jgi:hypothetical protein
MVNDMNRLIMEVTLVFLEKKPPGPVYIESKFERVQNKKIKGLGHTHPCEAQAHNKEN